MRTRINISLLGALLSVACTHGDVKGTAAVASTSTPDSATGMPGRASKRFPVDSATPIRGLYVNRFAAQSWKRIHHYLAIADSTEINALVIDIKDEFGLNFRSDDPLLQKNQGTATKVANLKAVVDTIRAHNVLPIARIVVFKDSVAARLNPNHVIRTPTGSPWRDKTGLTWVNPYARDIWEYNFRVADEAIKMGFGEIQFDYIRFPEPYKSLPKQVFPGSNNRSKAELLADFLSTANARYDKEGVRTTADIFGLVTTVNGALEIGQAWEPLTKAVDVLLPMVYPSHYPRGSFGIARPNANPYQVIQIAIPCARQRDSALGLKGERVRPWLQAFTLGAPPYGAHEVREQKRGVYDAGYKGWILWNPGSRYDAVAGAFDKEPVATGR